MAEEVRKVIHIDTQGSQTSVKDLRDNVKKLQDALLGLDSASEEYKQIATQIYSTQQKLNQVMSAGKNAITPYERSLKALTDTYANQRQELRALRTALENLDPASREYQVAFERAAEITHELQERQEMLRRSSSDLGAQLSNMQQIGTGIAAGFSSVNALMTLMGNDSENLQKQMVKLQAGMALVQGMKGLDGLTKAVKGYVNGAAKWFDSIKNAISGNKQLATQVQTASAAQEGLAVAENKATAGAAAETTALKVQTTTTVGATAAATALKAVLMSLGIGVVIAGISGLITLIGNIGKEAKESYDLATSSGEIYFDEVQREKALAEKHHQQQMEQLRAEGATEQQLREAEIAWIKQQGKEWEMVTGRFNQYYESVMKMKDMRNSFGGLIGDDQKISGHRLAKITYGVTEKDIANITMLGKEIQNLSTPSKDVWNTMSKESQKAFLSIRQHGIQTFGELREAMQILATVGPENWRQMAEEFNEDMDAAAKVQRAEYIKDAVDAGKSEIQLLKEQRNERIKVVGEGTEAEKLIRQQYNKQIWSIVTGQTQSIIDNAKSVNQTELENLQDKYNKERKILIQYGRSTVELTAAYEKQRQDIINKNTTTAITEYMRVAKNQVKELTKDSKFEEERLQALGLPSADAAQKRADEIYEYELQLANEELKLWKQVAADTAVTGEYRIQVEQKVSDLVLEIHEKENNKIIEDAKIRTQKIKEQLAELDKEIDKIEAGTRGKLANSRYNYEINSLPNNFWQNAAGTANPTFAAQKAQVEEEYKIVVEGLRKQIEAKKKFAEENKLIGDEKIKNDREIAALEAQIMQATNEAAIQQSEIQTEAWQTILDATLSVADSFADVLGSIADTMESQIERQKEAGEITEEEAEKQMDQVRAIQIAQAIINTLSGSIGAFTQASATIPPPAGQIVGAAAAAAVIAAGVAQIAQIRNTKKGSSNITSGLKAAAPALTDYTPEYTQNLTGNSEISSLRNALEGAEIHAYILEDEMQTANKRMANRKRESTF